ncbi:MAG: PVC-type heme-binding CxxCH protein, partial [Gemmataceae bacterium]
MRRPLSAFAALLAAAAVLAQKPPHGQDKLPGPALTPAQAVAKMKVPDGFTVELVACEPDLINPVAMTFDEKGRVWVTESLEYPRKSEGPGKDRVKVIEIGPDGKASKVTTFADGLNIPSGVAVGHGGLWVANAPDLLFYKVGTDGKAAGAPEVVVTGFGRTDTHELPNSLTWGPDGWLYGWNGVFNYSHVKYRGKEWKFTCAIFRVHPKTRDFELFCEGTSNPWGLAINENGDFFASACVIDHLWHLTETAYYQRQGGPYPPHTWPTRSIVKHRHQKAAYCGLTYFDSDAYPERYRGKLFMGNIHGGCINVDQLRRDGSTYFGTTDDDFLTANDPWFMPVVQKVGPDGSLYVLDWYDRYHCYQDANRDPKGIDRLSGRLYRVRYKDTPRAEPFDLSKDSDGKLVERLKSPNVFFRDTAQRVLTERVLAGGAIDELDALSVDAKAPRKARLHALWARIGGKLESEFHSALLGDADPTFRAWGVRAAGNAGAGLDDAVRAGLVRMLHSETSPDVLVQLAIANAKLGLGGIPTYFTLLGRAPGDKLLPHVVWQNMHPLLETQADAFAAAVAAGTARGEILPRGVERILSSRKPQTSALVSLYETARSRRTPDVATARRVLEAVAGKARTGELSAETLATLKDKLAPSLRRELEGRGPLRSDAALLLAALGDDMGLKEARRLLSAGGEAERSRALDVLASLKDASVLEAAPALLDAGRPADARAAAIAALGRLEDDRVAAVLLAGYAALPGDLKPRA